MRPEPVPALDPSGEYLTRVWNDSVYPLAARLGVTMRLPPVQPRTRLAHAAAKWASVQRRFDDYHEALFRAFFERGEDIGDSNVLVKLATNLQLDGEALRRSIAAREFEESVLADERDATNLGTRGVPAFIVNRRVAVSGVQPVTALQALVDRARPSR